VHPGVVASRYGSAALASLYSATAVSIFLSSHSFYVFWYDFGGPKIELTTCYV
jgi:hypothetical protein